MLANQFTARLEIARPDGNFVAWLCLLQADLPELEATMRESLYLHPQELDHYERLVVNARKASFLAGRWCAKKALVAACDDRQKARGILVQAGVLQHPVVREGARRATQVSISHADGAAAAVAFDESHPMGIDIERSSDRVLQVLHGSLTAHERVLLDGAQLHDDALGCTWLWTTKEALAKAMKVGLTIELDLYECQSAHCEGGLIVTRFRHFSQFKCLSFAWRGFVVSIALPWKSQLAPGWMEHPDISALNAVQPAAGSSGSMDSIRLRKLISRADSPTRHSRT